MHTGLLSQRRSSVVSTQARKHYVINGNGIAFLGVPPAALLPHLGINAYKYYIIEWRGAVAGGSFDEAQIRWGRVCMCLSAV